MLVFNYFIEIKNRIILIVMCWCSVVCVSYLYRDVLIFLLVKFSTKASDLTTFYFIATNLTDVIKSYLELSYFLGIQLSIFIFFFNFLVFLTPGLFVHEYKVLKNMLLTFFLFSIINLWLLNNYVLPNLCKFFLNFASDSSYKIDVFFEFKITEYLQFYKDIYYLSVLISQSFSIIFLLTSYSSNKKKFVLETRKYFYMLFLVMSTTLTPPDVFSQIFTIFSLGVCFEFLLILIFISDFYKNFILYNYNYFFKY